MSASGPSETLRGQRLLIIGTGLIGTSIGLAATLAGADVRLRDADPGHERLAASLGAGIAAPEPARGGDLGGWSPTLVVVAVPPGVVGPVCVEALRAYPTATVTHVSSVQTRPEHEVEHLSPRGELDPRFVGSHPVAGREVSGPAGAAADLFLDRPWVVCPTAHSAPAAVETVLALIRGCGAAPTLLAARDHDRVLARVSHAPQLVASALAAALLDLEPTAAALAGPGLRDTTRLADSDAAMWAQIAAANGPAVAAAVRAVAEPLLRLADDLDAGGTAAATAAAGLLDRGRRGRGLLPGKHGRPAAAVATVQCAVPDEPGALARLFADIAADGVNVEDLRVEHAPGQPVGLAELAVRPEDRDTLLVGLRRRGWAVAAGRSEAL